MYTEGESSSGAGSTTLSSIGPVVVLVEGFTEGFAEGLAEGLVVEGFGFVVTGGEGFAVGFLVVACGRGVCLGVAWSVVGFLLGDTLGFVVVGLGLVLVGFLDVGLDVVESPQMNAQGLTVDPPGGKGSDFVGVLQKYRQVVGAPDGKGLVVAELSAAMAILGADTATNSATGPERIRQPAPAELTTRVIRCKSMLLCG
ncbi:hypothetical protein [Streptodolium elevatio]|uniref:Uncharacterized protein n=1 Tax=Streptodolium elevatio TaxID=3157996 RepID=A0ABV3DR73_9ACTN